MKKPKIKKLKTSRRFRKPKLPGKPQLKRPVIKRTKTPEEKVSEAISNAPRITNETVAGHREEVLSSARKYIYPLQHSKHRVVRISVGLFIAVVVVFFVAIGLALYKFQNTSTFIYDVTRIIPLPVAKAGNSWVSYESYLFELRRNMHYYKTQQAANFDTPDGKGQLARLKGQAMSQVVQDAYVKQLAKEQGVSVSNQAVTNQLNLVRSQNRLGSNDRVFKDVLDEFWGWSESDFRRALKQQLLQQAVVTKLDTAANAKAESALQQVRGGEDFAAVAAQQSDDASTKGSGGQYPNPIAVGSRELSPTITDALFRLQPGGISDIINTGYTLEILKVIDRTDNTLRAAHIQFTLADINDYVKPQQTKHPSRQFIRF